MAHYLFQGGYAPDAWAGLMENPEDRTAVVRAAMESIGGKLEALYYTFGADDFVGLVRCHGDLHLQFRQEVHRVFGATVDLGVALLAAVAFDLADRHAVDADGVQRIAHVVELEGFDDGHDELHVSVSSPEPALWF